MKLICKTLNNIETNLLTYGDPFNCNGKDVIICITGNPGLIDFYEEFGEEVHRNSGLPVCVVGHAGHDKVPDAQSILEGQEHIFNLKGQLKHKLDLLENYIDGDSKLHFIGHSIGSWFTIELLVNNDHLYNRTLSVNLLFPTIQRMAQSKNGLWLNKYVRSMHTFVLFLVTLIYLMPITVTMLIINVYLKLKTLPTIYDKRILKFLDPKVIEKVLFLSYDEMDTVNSLNTRGMEKIKHLTYVIYTCNDGWAPLSFMEDLVKYEPDIKMQEVNADHAFVLKSSKSIALLVSNNIQTKSSKTE
ncbi:lipid droplet-associated hydrolase isoform X2 [Battus philenor]